MTEIEASKLASPQNDSESVKILVFYFYKTKEQLVVRLFFESQGFPLQVWFVEVI